VGGTVGNERAKRQEGNLKLSSKPKKKYPLKIGENEKGKDISIIKVDEL